MIEKILKLGNPLLYQASTPVLKSELRQVQPDIDLLHSLILAVREVHGFGRGIAAPQIGLMKRIICLNVKGEKKVLINPRILSFSDEMIELWDDCMCFPNLLVKVQRYKRCSVEYLDENWNIHQQEFEDDMSELIQHEYDHLEGILATQRAIDPKSFKLK